MKIAILLVTLYRNILSQFMLQSCRFTPSCSRYAEEALRKFGLRKGLALALKRLLRCQPFCPGGVDQVP